PPARPQRLRRRRPAGTVGSPFLQHATRRVRHRRLLDTAGCDIYVGLGGGHVGVTEQPLYLGYRSRVLDQQGRVGVAEGVGERPRRGSDARPAEPAANEVVDDIGREWLAVGADDQRIGGLEGPESLLA